MKSTINEESELLTREQQIFAEYPVPKAVATMVIPTIISQIITVIYNLADTWYVGLTGNAAAVAAISLCLPVYNIMTAFGNLFGIGGSSVIARALGTGDQKRAKIAFSVSFFTYKIAIKEILIMSKKVLILSGSPRKNGNSDMLCDEFMKGALEGRNEVEKIRVAEKKIGYCRGCYACKDTGVCAVKDDMAEILQKMIDADVIVLASPVYFYSIDAQLKTLIDRTVARWLEVKDKEFYYIMTAADDEKASMETTLACFRGYADCVEGAKEMGVIYGTGVYEKGEIKNTKAITEAFEMGKRV